MASLILKLGSSACLPPTTKYFSTCPAQVDVTLLRGPENAALTLIFLALLSAIPCNFTTVAHLSQVLHVWFPWTWPHFLEKKAEAKTSRTISLMH